MQVWLCGRLVEVMSKKVFDKIAAGLEEALSIARGEAKPFKLNVPVEMMCALFEVKLACHAMNLPSLLASRLIKSENGSKVLIALLVQCEPI
jgi:hypothetical protein